MTTIDLCVEHLAIDLLRPDPTNPRRISDAEMEALTRSLKQWSFVNPILARREDNVIIGGHQRLVAARRLGYKTVPVIFIDLTVEQSRALNLALNKISGTWDEELLARLLADLKLAPNLDLSLTGFGDDEVTKLLKKLEVREKRERLENFDLYAALDAARAAPRAKHGDLFALGDHRLLCGDATDPTAIARLKEWEKENERNARRFTVLAKAGTLKGRRRAGELEIKVESFYAWLGEKVTVRPDWGSRYDPAPDREAATVSQLEANRERIRGTFGSKDEGDVWKGRPAYEAGRSPTDTPAV